MSKQRPTIEDVAALAGVSIKTVSRVVNREPNVRETTREKVDRAIASLGYRPNSSARNLASHRSRLIVLMYDDPSSYSAPSAGYIINMQAGVLQVCHERGYELLIFPYNYRDTDPAENIQELVDRTRPAGIILAAPLSNMQNIVDAVAASGAPCVRLSTGSGNGKEYSVATNDREISAEMTCYLASLGHRHIAFIKGDKTHKAVSNRFDGYKDGLKQSGLGYTASLVAAGDNSIGAGEACAERLLQQKPRPTAIFSANDDMAAGVVRVAARQGIRIPEELSVAGCDDIALAQMIFPALTTIRQPLGAMAYAASQALIDGSRGFPRKPVVDIVPGTIEIRESTGPAPRNN